MKTDKIKENITVQLLKGICETEKVNNMQLVGGAIIDLLEGRVPKDYDIISQYEKDKIRKGLKELGFIFMFETSTAQTFKRNSIKIQLLKTDLVGFDFTISKAQYNPKTDKLIIDQECFEKKMLIPSSFDNRKAVLNSLSRIPHWIKKGYTIKNATYFSLLNCLNDKEVTNIERYPFES